MRQLFLAFKPSDEFYNSAEWLDLRYRVLTERGRRCECCGTTPHRGTFLQVDHVVPINIDPTRKLDVTNLQVLCWRCNRGKGATIADFRHITNEVANDDFFAEYEGFVSG
jgi:5-methylcytosine-specific restriction endonuclease McrA